MPGGGTHQGLLQSTGFGDGTHLVYHVDEGLGVIHTEATDHTVHIHIQEDFFDKRRKFVQCERAIGQTSEGWSTKVEKEG